MRRKKSNNISNNHTNEHDVGHLVRRALLLWGFKSPKHLSFFIRITWRMLLARLRCIRCESRINVRVPRVLAISPTMRCNYNCIGCYSRGRSTENELTTEELDRLFDDAEKFGVLAIVITGGEPLLREDIIDIIERHKRLLFILITNGSIINPEVSLKIAKGDNIVTLISIDGHINYNDERRRVGAYNSAIKAFKLLNELDSFYGFAATNTASNIDHLGSDEFIDKMIDLGCSIGYFTEYVPCDLNPRGDWILNEGKRDEFRNRVLELRQRKQIVLVQFPHDEYGIDNICKAAGNLSLHINSQGDIEPCPFVPISYENIRNGGLITACQSPFMHSIREHPELLKRKKYACSLFENLENVRKLATQCRIKSNRN